MLETAGRHLVIWIFLSFYRYLVCAQAPSEILMRIIVYNAVVLKTFLGVMDTYENLTKIWIPSSEKCTQTIFGCLVHRPPSLI